MRLPYVHRLLMRGAVCPSALSLVSINNTSLNIIDISSELPTSWDKSFASCSEPSPFPKKPLATEQLHRQHFL